jgi:alkanesulfonate monooxygenase SsuD/methylene tetrahydromethanopterin reductase-like flavin-dependent oxidoreductase (luciferase family)
MEFGIFNLMTARDRAKPAAEIFSETAEETRIADELGYAVAWFAEHHFSNYCLCASPLMMVAHCAPLTKRIRLGTAVVVVPLYQPARLLAEIAMVDALSNGRLALGLGSGYQPYEFERFGVDLSHSTEMLEEFCDIVDMAFAQDFFSYSGKYYRIPKTHIPARPVQHPIPIWVAGHSPPLFQLAARRGYRALSSGRTGSIADLAEARQMCVDAYRSQGVATSRMHLGLERFCCITNDRDEALRFAENVRYRRRLASGLRRREEVMDGTMLVDRPFPDEPSVEQICDNLLIGDVDLVAQKVIDEIRTVQPNQLFFSFRVGATQHKTALRSMERFMIDVCPLIERELGPIDKIGLA